MLFLTLLTPQHGGYLHGSFLCLSAVLRLLHGVLFYKAFLKSDTAVALRRSLSKVPCITVVSFINVYHDLLSLQNPRMFWKQNITERKLRFMDINMNFIDQNIYVLCNIKSYECHLMKIIKG